MIKHNQWYKLNEKEFTNILQFVNQDIANNQKNIESLNRIADAFTNNKVLYLKLSRESIRQPLSWHYRTSYSEFYNGQCLEYTDIVFDIVNGTGGTGKHTIITNYDNVNYQLVLGTWYEVNEKEYDYIICGLPYDISKDLCVDQIDYGYRAAKNRSQIYIMLDYYRELDDEHCRLNVSKNAPKEYARPITLTKVPNNSLNDIILRSGDDIYWENDSGAHSGTVHDSDGKRIKDSSFANDKIIKIVRAGKVIYDRQEVNRARTAEKLIMNSVYGARRFLAMCDNFDAMFYADWDACMGKESNKEKEKVMEGNKIEAIREIVNKYEDNEAKELTRQYNEQEKEVKEKDPNIIALKQYVEVLNKNRKENTEPYNIIGFDTIYTAKTQVQLDELYQTLMSKKKALHDKCSEVYNICILCDTYEQMRQVLADYEIIPNTKKRGK